MKDLKNGRLLAAARTVFLQYGYRRATMSDIAVVASISRAALYLSFKNKEEIFEDVVSQWIEESVLQVQNVMAESADPLTKLQRAFEVWVVLPFEMLKSSPAAKDLIECSLAFAQSSVRHGYRQFEAEISPVLASLSGGLPSSVAIAPASRAHMLASAVRGLQQAATTVAELRTLIAELLALTCGAETSDKGTRHRTNFNCRSKII